MFPLRNLKRFLWKALRQPFYAASVGWRRALAGLAYNFGQGRSSCPESITFFLTRLCNLRCKMCGQWQNPIIKKSDELTLNQWKDFIKNLPYKNLTVQIWGGEPFLAKGLTGLIHTIKDKGYKCLVITNGYFLNKSG